MATPSKWRDSIRVWTLPGITDHPQFNPGVRVLVFLLGLLPFAGIVYGAASNALGPDPAEALMHQTGEWVLRFLVLVLLARPLASMGWSRLFRYRRMFGLYMYFYTTLHLGVFAQVYIGWSGAILLEELVERPYVVVGFAAWVLLLPLAITSTDGWRRRLGRRWRQLHQLVYPVTVLGWLHLLWLSRSDVGQAVLYGAIFALLLGWRLRGFMTKVLRQ